jgi:DNA-binding beta-propeller fold protein YncE
MEHTQGKMQMFRGMLYATGSLCAHQSPFHAACIMREEKWSQEEEMWRSRLKVVACVAVEMVLSAAIMAVAAADDAPNGWLLVANKGDATLGIVDTAHRQQLVAIAEGGITGHEVAASPDGKTAFVPIYGDSGVGMPGTDGSTIAVIDLASRKVRGTIDLGRGLRPHCAVFGPVNGMLYVTTELSDSITEIDPRMLKVLGTIPTGAAQSHMLAISSDGKRGYTANVSPGSVSAIDLDAKKVIAIIPISENTQRIAISRDNHWVFTADQKPPRLAVIDTKKNAVSRWVPLPSAAYGTAATFDGKWLLITQPTTAKVLALNLATMQIEKAFDVAPSPQEIVVRPDNKRAYISCDKSSEVAVLNLETWQMDAPIGTGHGADGLAWAKR